MEREVAFANIFRFGLFEADAVGGQLMRNGVRIKIQDQPFRVLLLLLGRPGEIVTRDELRQKLWPEGTYVDFDGSLNVILKKLRAAIDDDSDNPRFIETVPRRGYRFIAPVSSDRRPEPVIVEPPQAGAVVVKEVQPAGEPVSAPQVATVTGRRSLLIYTYRVSVVASLVLIATGLLWWHYKRSGPLGAKESGHGLAPVQIRKSVAVLGFHSLSGKAEDAWLATALSEMLSTELSGGEKLRLVSGEDVANLRIASPWSQTDTLDEGTTARIG